jgi:hypothetical protein
VCEDIILETAKLAIEPISTFMLKVSAFRLRASHHSGATKEYLYKQNFATPGSFCIISYYRSHTNCIQFFQRNASENNETCVGKNEQLFRR